jgi:hypothetical protein
MHSARSFFTHRTLLIDWLYELSAAFSRRATEKNSASLKPSARNGLRSASIVNGSLRNPLFAAKNRLIRAGVLLIAREHNCMLDFRNHMKTEGAILTKRQRSTLRFDS